MDCADCFTATQDKIEKSESKVGQYGTSKDTQILKTCRKSNGVEATKAHEDAAFGHHAEGILADCYIGQILRTDLGSPPAILDYKIDCSVEELKSVSLCFNVLY